MKSFPVLFYIVFIISIVSATDYCSEKICEAGIQHIACNHSKAFDHKLCSPGTIEVNITDDLKKVLVDEHNFRRNNIAGGNIPRYSRACRMATMEWDSELAEIASLGVKKCKMDYDKCRNTDAFKYVGQNLAQTFGYEDFFDGSFDASKLREAVEMWYSEVIESHQGHINSYPNNYTGPVIGHFTVMMADRNNRVGCAASIYTPIHETYNVYLVACNYATTNMIGYPIYAHCNNAGTSCINGTNTEYPNLCSTLEQYDVNEWS